VPEPLLNTASQPVPQPRNARRLPVLLAYRTLYLGDLLSGLPALRGLAGAFPDHHRVLAVPAALVRLAEAAGVADEVLATPELGRPPLRAPAVAVDLHGRGPLSHRVLQAMHPGRLLAFACAEAGVEGPQWWPEEHEVHRWCRMLGWWGVAADPGRLELDVTPAAAPAVARGATVVHPGASAPARRWPPERWAAVAAAEQAAGRSVVITGGRAERALAGEVAALAGVPPANNLAGRTPDAIDLAAVVAGAARVVSADTGTAHLATALGRPSVVLFGPTPPSEWGPPPDRPQHRALWAGERGDPSGGRPGPGLLRLTVDDVLAALAALPSPMPGCQPWLDGSAPRPRGRPAP